MVGKNILLSAVRGERTPRAAWLPFVGVHGGFLTGVKAPDYLRSAERMLEGLRTARELYRPDGLPVAFDLQIEAEILGCDLQWADEVPPAVTSHPLGSRSLRDLPVLDESRGRFPQVTQVLDALSEEMGDEVALYGLVCGPFTLALHLMGHEIFLEMFDREEYVREVLAYSATVAIASAGIYLDHGADVIAVVDPMTSQISSEHFLSFVSEPVDRVFDAIRDRGALSSLFVCGDANRNLEAMCRTGADNISVDEQIPLDRLKELAGRHRKSFGGNLKLTSVLLLGDRQDAQAEALSCLDSGGTEGFVLAPGCDLPYAVPPENLQAVAELVHDEYSRKVARSALKTREIDNFDDIELPDYASADGVIVDVITLDSTSCAPCQYMMEAVTRAAESARNRVWVNEHKIKARQGLGMMARLGVKNLPTICINGNICFASIIPDHKTLVKALEQAGGGSGS